MSEKEHRQTIVKALRSLHAKSIENLVGIGTPDVNYAFGWIEVKCVEQWPVRPGTPVRLDHDLTPEQRIWLEDRWEAGGEAYVLIKAEQDWFLFEGPKASRLIGTATRETLINSADMVFMGNKQLEKELAQCLSRRANCRRVSASSSTGVGGS